MADRVILCNPNNPDGRRFTASELRPLADRLALRGGWLVIDEAFADYEPPGTSMAPLLPHPAIVVLRSFGKTYGLAGIRLGFILADAATASLMRLALGPWAVSGPALEAGIAALEDDGWRRASMAQLTADATRLDALLTSTRLRLVGGTSLFRLYEGRPGTVLARLPWTGRHPGPGLRRTCAMAPFRHPRFAIAMDQARTTTRLGTTSNGNVNKDAATGPNLSGMGSLP